MGYNFFPELDYYFNKYWRTEGEIITDHISLPEIDKYVSRQGSIFQVLFDNSYTTATCDYLFNITTQSYLHISIRERLGYTHKDIVCYESKDSGCPDSNLTDGTCSLVVDSEFAVENPLEFTPCDILMFEILLHYRMSGSVPNDGTADLIISDGTGTINITQELDNIDYDSLGTSLSMMIYGYLQSMINFNFEYIYETTILGSTMLETLYEIYMINESHKLLKTDRLEVSYV